ncbi:hypothetical protein WN55_06234 [Dufourea novaeangliae]|uniref:Uncharacterized protein n=1 Tax=Dufourea novaeangliae TaxID=178035 RepID=A0A154PQL7_DUFNO|nr:hypothetical protein WN55_06234 [Dufourea novaeangliae]
MYGQQSDQLMLRREFEAQVWNADETFADCFHDKVTLANRVHVALRFEIIGYIIGGIPSQKLRTQAKVHCYQFIETMLTAFATSLPSSYATSRCWYTSCGLPSDRQRWTAAGQEAT